MNKMSIQQLAENYGTYDLLTAYIMRTAGVDKEKAIDIVYQLDSTIERWIEDEWIEDEDEEY